MKRTIKELLDAGVHFDTEPIDGIQKMAEFIYGHRNGIHIIDLQQTVSYFDNALKVVSDLLLKIKTFYLLVQSVRPQK